MYTTWRMLAIVGVFVAASVAWLILGAVTSQRTKNQGAKLGGEVVSLWGQPQVQQGPSFEVAVTTPRELVVRDVLPSGDQHQRRRARRSQAEGTDVVRAL